MNHYLKLKKRIKKNEGFRNQPYLDKLGFLTIGYGHLITKKEKNLHNLKQTKKTLSLIFESDFNKAVISFNKLYKKYQFPKNVENTLIEMIFQLGVQRQKKFKKMISHLIGKRVYMASFEMKNSLWYKQTPKRVDGLIKNLLKQNNEN